MEFSWNRKNDSESFVYHPRMVRGLAILFWFGCGWWLVQLALTGGIMEWVTQLPVIACLALTMYLVFWVPGVRFERDAVTLENVSRVIRVPYADLESVATKFAFTLHDKSGKKYVAWAAPAGSSVRTLRTSTKEGLRQAGHVAQANLGRKVVSASELPGSDSGNVAMYVARRWAAWQEAKRGFGESLATGERTEVTWRWPFTIPWLLLSVYSFIAVLRWLS